MGFYLKQYGYEIVAFNYRCPMGEIDLIAKEAEFSSFARAKYRKDLHCGSAAEAVESQKTEADLEVCALLSYRAWDRGCAVSV